MILIAGCPWMDLRRVLTSGGFLNHRIFKTKKFQKQVDHWKQVLKDTGFVDIEDDHGNLKTGEMRTNALRSPDKTLRFFLTLDHFMMCYPQMPRFEKKVMQMYSDGMHLKKIKAKTKATFWRIKSIIKMYKYLVLAIITMQDCSNNPPPLRLASNKVSEVTQNEEDRIQNKAS